MIFANDTIFVLASGSPRRAAYLRAAGLRFVVDKAAIEETPEAGETPLAYVRRMAYAKTSVVSLRRPGEWVLGGDTVVCIGETILGKPADPAEAVQMLLALAGKTHRVHTAVCLIDGQPQRSRVQTVTSAVTFASFAEDLARAYTATGEGFDKAGGYGIQGQGGMLVESIAGSYSNVVGLPLVETLALLRQSGLVRVRGEGTEGAG